MRCSVRPLLLSLLSALVLALAKENCDLIRSHEQDENLETYFINLVGGGENV